MPLKPPVNLMEKLTLPERQPPTPVQPLMRRRLNGVWYAKCATLTGTVSDTGGARCPVARARKLRTARQPPKPMDPLMLNSTPRRTTAFQPRTNLPSATPFTLMLPTQPAKPAVTVIPSIWDTLPSRQTFQPQTGRPRMKRLPSTSIPPHSMASAKRLKAP